MLRSFASRLLRSKGGYAKNSGTQHSTLEPRANHQPTPPSQVSVHLFRKERSAGLVPTMSSGNCEPCTLLTARLNKGAFQRPVAAPDVDATQVPKALATLPSTTGAGPSGVRPSHLKIAMRPTSSDHLLRVLGEVVSLMLPGEVPPAIRSFFCGGEVLCPGPARTFWRARTLLGTFSSCEHGH